RTSRARSPRKVRAGHPRVRDGRPTTDAPPRQSRRRADQNSSEEHPVAIDTLLVVVGVYGSVDDAKADYELVGDLHTEAGLIDAYDAAVIERTDKGKTKIVKKHETPTRVGGALGRHGAGDRPRRRAVPLRGRRRRPARGHHRRGRDPRRDRRSR